MEFDPCYSETIYTSITPYVEFILNSSPKKFLFIVDDVLVFWLLFFAFMKRQSHFVRWELKILHATMATILCTPLQTWKR